jgi:hypothetical protein
MVMQAENYRQCSPQRWLRMINPLYPIPFAVVKHELKLDPATGSLISKQRKSNEILEISSNQKIRKSTKVIDPHAVTSCAR